MATSAMGKVKYINRDKGFGFISQMGGQKNQKDLFMHVSNLQEGLEWDDLDEGSQVAFEVESSDKGLRAINIRKA